MKPTLIATDAQGQIVVSDQTDNYRVRPDPEAIAELLAAMNLEN